MITPGHGATRVDNWVVTPTGVRVSSHINSLAAKVPSDPVKPYQGLTSCGSNFSSHEKQNPGALAGAAGADSKGQVTSGTGYRKTKRNAISAFAQDRHRRAAKIIGLGLIIDTPEAWESVSHLLALHLSAGERAALLLAALHALQTDEAEVICDLAFSGGAA